MRASAVLEAVHDGDDTRPAVLAGEPPLVLRRTGTDGGALRVHLVTAAGGPCAGDELHLRVRVGRGARLELRSTAASVALPGRGGGTSRLLTEIEVEAGGVLVWKPEPTVAAAGSDHVLETVVRLAPSAALVIREELLAGRSGEDPGGRLHAGLRVERTLSGPRQAVYEQELALEPGVGPLGTMQGSAARGLSGVRALGSLVVVGGAGEDADFAAPDEHGQRLLGSPLSALGGPGTAAGVLSRLAAPNAYAAACLAADAVSLRRLLADAEERCAPLLSVTRLAVRGSADAH